MAKPPIVFEPAGPSAELIRGVFWLVLALAAVIFLLVGGAMTAFILRFRQRQGDEDTEPPQVYGSHPIELAWTLGPLLTVVVLGLVVIRSLVEIRHDAIVAGGENVRVVGHQWWWEFEYPDYGFTTANELVIPASDASEARHVNLQLESADVIHSFWIPQLAGKTDLVPGRTNRMGIEASAEGTYFGRCAEYCGTQHARMLLRATAVSPEEFKQWVAVHQQPARDDPSVAAGRELFMQLACANCHNIKGTQAHGKFGPDLTHLMSRQTLAAGVVPNNRDNLSQWVADPDAIKPGCNMPDMRLSKQQVTEIVDYLMSLE